MRQLGLVILLVGGLIDLHTIPRLIQVSQNPPSLIGGGGFEAMLNWLVMFGLLLFVSTVPIALGIWLATREPSGTL